MSLAYKLLINHRDTVHSGATLLIVAKLSCVFSRVAASYIAGHRNNKIFKSCDLAKAREPEIGILVIMVELGGGALAAHSR